MVFSLYKNKSIVVVFSEIFLNKIEEKPRLRSLGIILKLRVEALLLRNQILNRYHYNGQSFL